MDVARFLVVAVAGLALDLGLAWLAHAGLGLPLVIAAALGFCGAAAANYAAHELWTFRQGARRLSSGRALRYAGVVALTLLTRLALVAMLEASRLLPPLPVLALATLGSFAVHFLAARRLVFRPAGDGGTPE